LTVDVAAGVTQLGEEFATARIDDSQDRSRKKEEKVRKDVISWLSTTDPSTNHVDQRRKHQATTGDWFVKGKNMDQWETSPNSFIWLDGTCKP